MDANEIILELISLGEHVKNLQFQAPELIAHRNQAERRVKDAIESMKRVIEADEE